MTAASAQLHIEFDAQHVTVTTDVPEMGDYIARVYSLMLADCPVDLLATVVFSETPQGFALTARDRTEYSGIPENFLALVKEEVVRAFSAARTDLEWIHASAVTRDDACCLFIGPSQAGKSTLASDLCHLGWKLVAEDVTPIRCDSAEAIPFPQQPRPRRFEPDSAISGSPRPERDERGWRGSDAEGAFTHHDSCISRLSRGRRSDDNAGVFGLRRD